MIYFAWVYFINDVISAHVCSSPQKLKTTKPSKNTVLHLFANPKFSKDHTYIRHNRSEIYIKICIFVPNTDISVTVYRCLNQYFYITNKPHSCM